MQTGCVMYQLQKLRPTQCKLYCNSLSIVGSVVIRIMCMTGYKCLLCTDESILLWWLKTEE